MSSDNIYGVPSLGALRSGGRGGTLISGQRVPRRLIRFRTCHAEATEREEDGSKTAQNFADLALLCPYMLALMFLFIADIRGCCGGILGCGLAGTFFLMACLCLRWSLAGDDRAAAQDGFMALMATLGQMRAMTIVKWDAFDRLLHSLGPTWNEPESALLHQNVRGQRSTQET